MMKELMLALGLSGLLFGLSGCSTKTVPSQLADTLASSYVAPATYGDHRAQQQLFETGSGKIAFTDHGPQLADTPTIVLLHGVPTSSWMYRKVVPSLQLNMRVITVDHLGYGSSEKPKREEADYSAAAQARRVEALLASRGVTNYSVLMHDMGGLVAWEMLEKNPDAIDNLIVLNTIVGDEGFEQPDMESGFFVTQLMKAYAAKLTSAAILDRTFSDLGLKGEYKLTEDECYGYVRPMREGADDALYSFFTNINDDLFVDLAAKHAAWPAYKGKVMVMWGAKDETLTTGQIPTLKAAFNIPDNDIHIYENNAHFLAEEISEEIVTKVSAFVK
ncbi:MAG: alpha/beta hydrolase [Maricaulaceae bacterium]